MTNSNSVEINDLLKSSKSVISTALKFLLIALVFMVPAASVNHPDAMYLSALLLVLIGWVSLPFTLRTLQFDMLEKAMVFFWLFYCVFTLVDLNVRGPWDWTEFQEPSRFVLLAPVFLYVRRYGISINALRWGVFIGAVAAGIWGLYQKVHLGVHRSWGGTSGRQIAAFGDVGLILGVMSVALFQPLWRNSWLWRGVTVISLIFGLFASLSSGTKGGWISAPFLCWVLVELTANPTYKKRFTVIGLLFVFAVLVWMFVPFIQDRVSVIVPAIYEYFVNGKVNDFSAGIRLAMWHASTLIFLDNPIFGTGPGSYWDQQMIYVDQGILPVELEHFTGPHSQLFNSLYESGVFGPFMVYGIYISFILHCKRYLVSQKALATAGILMAIGFMDFGLVEVIWDVNVAGVFFTTMMVTVAGQLSFNKANYS